MKVIIYEPCRIFAEEMTVFYNVTSLRVTKNGYSVKQGTKCSATRTDKEFELVLLDENETDNGQ